MSTFAPFRNPVRIIGLCLMITLLHAHLCAQLPSGPPVSLVVDYSLGDFVSAVSLSVNTAGELVVLDAGADACIRLSTDGTELSRIQGRGWGTTEFDGPTDVNAAFPLAIFVADGKNKRVQQFDKELHYVQTIAAQNQSGSHEPNDSQLLEQTFRPIASVQSPQGELFVIDADANRVVKFTPRFQPEREFGTYASGEGRLESPTDLCMTEDGKVAVCDGHRIVFFDQFGNYLFTHRLDSLLAVRAVSSSGSDLCAVSADRITVFDVSPSSPVATASIGRSMVMGESVEEFRDAARTNQWWYVLTPKSVLVCRRAR